MSHIKKMAAKLMENLQAKDGPSNAPTHGPTINADGATDAAARLAQLFASRVCHPAQSHISTARDIALPTSDQPVTIDREYYDVADPAPCVARFD